MNINTKLEALQKIYSVYEDFIKQFDISCKKGCSSCCTRNVTLTTLEAYNIILHLIRNNNFDIIEKIKTRQNDKRFIPKITINRIAELCMQEQEIPEEKNNSLWGGCPFLEQEKCLVYDVRPFECRSMVSKNICSKTGYAEIEPLILSVNEVFQQYIEHIDNSGFFGNFTDIMLLISDKKYRDDYMKNILQCQGSNFIANIPIKILMMPPEYRETIKPLLNRL